MLESMMMYKGFYTDPGLLMAMDFEGPGQTFVDQFKPSRPFGRYSTVADVDINQTRVLQGVSSMRHGQVTSGASGVLWADMISSDLIFPGDFWIEMWGWCNGQGDTNFTGGNNTLFSWGQYAATGGMSRWAMLNLKPTFTIASGTTTSTLYTGTGTSTNNAWHHYAMGRSGNQLLFFLDGVISGQTTYAATIGFGSRVIIGGYSDTRISNGTYAGWNGFLDRLRVYNRCLYTSTFTPTKAMYGKAP